MSIHCLAYVVSDCPEVDPITEGSCLAKARGLTCLGTCCRPNLSAEVRAGQRESSAYLASTPRRLILTRSLALLFNLLGHNHLAPTLQRPLHRWQIAPALERLCHEDIVQPTENVDEQARCPLTDW